MKETSANPSGKYDTAQVLEFQDEIREKDGEIVSLRASRDEISGLLKLQVATATNVANDKVKDLEQKVRSLDERLYIETAKAQTLQMENGRYKQQVLRFGRDLVEVEKRYYDLETRYNDLMRGHLVGGWADSASS